MTPEVLFSAVFNKRENIFQNNHSASHALPTQKVSMAPLKRKRRYSRRGNRKRRRVYRKRRFFRSTRRVARRAYSIAKGVASLVETKYVDFTSASYPTLNQLDNDPDFVYMTPIAQGIAVNQRVGVDIMVKSMTLSMLFRWNSVSRFNYIRVMLCTDRQYHSSDTPAFSEFYLNNGTPGQFDIFPLRNWNTRKRLKVIWNKLIKLDDTNTLARRVYKTIRFRRGFKTQFNGVGNTISGVAFRPLFMFIWSDSATGANGPTYNWTCRTTFKDA